MSRNDRILLPRGVREGWDAAKVQVQLQPEDPEQVPELRHGLDYQQNGIKVNFETETPSQPLVAKSQLSDASTNIRLSALAQAEVQPHIPCFPSLRAHRWAPCLPSTAQGHLNLSPRPLTGSTCTGSCSCCRAWAEQVMATRATTAGAASTALPGLCGCRGRGRGGNFPIPSQQPAQSLCLLLNSSW